MRKLNIACINANGRLREEAIDSVLYYCNNIDLLFITETWLPPAVTSLPTTWQQFHIYGKPVHNSFRHEMGISLFINPSFQHNNFYVDTSASEYYMTCRIDNTLIYCFYLPPTPSLNDTIALDILKSLPFDSNLILCGDFNARMGKYSGDHKWNTRGSKLAALIRRTGLFNWNSKLQYKIPTRLNYNTNTHKIEQSIVDYFFTTFDLAQPQMEIRTDLAILGSDHKLMTLSFNYADSAHQQEEPPQQRKRWKLVRLEEPEVQKAYIQCFIQQSSTKNLISKMDAFNSYLTNETHVNLTANLQDNIGTIEFLTEELYECLYYSLDTIVTESRYRKKNWKWFWNKSLQTQSNLRQACYTRWRKSVGLPKGMWWKKYKQADQDLKAMVKKARASHYQKFCDVLDKNPIDAMPIVKRIVHSKTRNTHRYTSPQGPKQAVENMALYLKEIYAGHNIPQPENNIIHILRTNDLITDSSNPYDYHGCPFQENYIYNAIKRLQNPKSPGSDHITAGMLKPIITPLSKLLLQLFRSCWIVGYSPDLWRQSQVVPIYKGGGDQTDASNFRPISLTSVFRKILEYCLQPLLYEQTDFIDITQGGFKPQLSAIDQAVCLDELMFKYRRNNNNSNPAVIALDVAKAYDQCSRSVIWNAMYNNNCNFKLLNILKNLFDDVKIQVINSNFQSTSFCPTTGVLQGSVLSPHLYSIFINTLPQLLRNNTIHPSIREINCLLFADDVVLISDPDKMQDLLNICEQHSLLNGYRWSPTKCMVLSSTDDPTNAPSYTLYNTPLKNAKHIRYLGLQFNHLGLDSQALITSLREKVSTSMHRIHQIGARMNGFSLPLSIKIYKQFIRPKIEYGLCISNFKKINHPALERLQDDCLRMIVGGFSNSSMKSLRVTVNLPSMVERWYILNSKYNIRAATLPPASLISKLLNLTKRYSKINLIKKKNPIYQKLITDNNHNISIYTKLTNITNSFRSQAIINSSEKMIQASRSTLILDPILTIPMTRKERRRILRWRMNWLPGDKKQCYCGELMSRNHLFTCGAIPPDYWEHIQRGNANNTKNPIDVVLKKLPTKKPKSTTEKLQLLNYWKPLWSDLLNILYIVDQITNKSQDTFVEEPSPGELFYNWIAGTTL